MDRYSGVVRSLFNCCRIVRFRESINIFESFVFESLDKIDAFEEPVFGESMLVLDDFLALWFGDLGNELVL